MTIDERPLEAKGEQVEWDEQPPASYPSEVTERIDPLDGANLPDAAHAVLEAYDVLGPIVLDGTVIPQALIDRPSDTAGGPIDPQGTLF